MKQFKAPYGPGNYKRSLKVIKGGKTETKLKGLVSGALSFARICLWNGINLSSVEIKYAKQIIEDRVANADLPEKECKRICERILLAHQYILRNPGKYIPVPSAWFNQNNLNGFAGTEKWYDTVALIRLSLPDYKKNFKALCEAVTEFAEDSTLKNYKFWSEYFAERKDLSLLQLFQLFTADNFFKSY